MTMSESEFQEYMDSDGWSSDEEGVDQVSLTNDGLSQLKPAWRSLLVDCAKESLTRYKDSLSADEALATPESLKTLTSRQKYSLYVRIGQKKLLHQFQDLCTFMIASNGAERFKDNLSNPPTSSMAMATNIKPTKERLRSGDGRWVMERQIGMNVNVRKTLHFAHGVTVNPHNQDIVVTEIHSGVKVYDMEGNFKHELTNGDEGYFNKPHDVVVSSINDQYYVTDRTGFVKVYSPDGEYLIEFPTMSPQGVSSESSLQNQLLGICIDNDGYLLVGKGYEDPYISKHRQDGTHVASFSVDRYPFFLAMTSQGRIVIGTGSSEDTVCVIDELGNLVHNINPPHDAVSWHPHGVCCCGEDDIILISNYEIDDGGGIYSFTAEGEYLGCTKDLPTIFGLDRTADDKLVVAQWSKGVKVFSYKGL